MKRLLILTLMAALCLCTVDAQKQKRSGKRSTKETTEAKAERLYQEAEELYFGTDKVFMNREKAAELYRQSAELGYPPAMDRLGYGYLYGDMGLAKDGEQCVFWFRKAAEKNNCDAQHGLAICYSDGIGVPIDSVQSIYWLEIAARNGNSASQYCLGMEYCPRTKPINASLRKAGYQYDADKAIYWLKKAAEQEYRDAFWQLSNLCHNLGLYEESVEWGIKAAERKDPYALLACGTLCYNGKDGFPKDRNIAFKYLSYLANKPELLKDNEWRADTYYYLAWCYFKGDGTEENDKLAFKYFSLVPAECYERLCDCPIMLGGFYEGSIEGAPYKDVQKAIEYYKIAMSYNNLEGFYCYAVALYDGAEGNNKRKEGLKMLRKLARNGMEAAIKYLNCIGQKY